eukprot:SAG31_NODE_41167_length_277_cov_0.865169_1_plen_45_part_10
MLVGGAIFRFCDPRSIFCNKGMDLYESRIRRSGRGRRGARGGSIE